MTVSPPSPRPRHRTRMAAVGGALGLAMLLSGCDDPSTQANVSARPIPTPTAQYRNGTTGPYAENPHVPDFANRNFVPFNRLDAVAIAMREWRLFGEPVDDDDPEERPEPTSALVKPERLPGLWERVGEYWWIGQDPYETEASWTGKHNSSGTPFAFEHDGHYAWSAAFISYVMRVAGAGDRFAYSPNHATYINAAASGTESGVRAQAPGEYAPSLGDLICAGRGGARAVRFTDLPTRSSFPAHCGLVVATAPRGQPGRISIIGGNVDDAVTMTHVPVDAKGMISGPDGQSYDTRYPWLVVLQVLYTANDEGGGEE
ncbi:hypothetical protein FHR90_001715 [Endobacter medicaginis]|jgi:Uncharacterized protein conserved in bacteria (DUF2272)|uniref:DUF2272 domain-containing protein n=2 Tax=Endobacter medicaginis TaxID=1181271 RepID=A0A839UZR5_9PROT|nr:hypothetical protein [Endobacter medicaginis]